MVTGSGYRDVMTIDDVTTSARALPARWILPLDGGN